MNSIPKLPNESAYLNLCLKILINAVKTMLPLQLPTGRFCCSREDTKKAPDDYIYFYTKIKEGYVAGQHFLYPCAFLYTFNHENNPYYKSPKLLQAIRKGGRFSCKNVTRYVFMPERFIISHSQAYALIQHDLPKKEKAAWRKFLLHMGRDMEKRVKRALPRITDYTTMDIGVNPNHWAYYVIGLMWLGKLFKKPAWINIGHKELKALTRSQHPDGYWNEWNGPTPGYNQLHIFGTGIYYRETKDPAAKRAIQRALNFQMHFSYPDGKAVETLDGRRPILKTVRYGGMEGHAAFSFFPEGRSFSLNLLKLLVAEQRSQNKKWSDLGQDTEFYCHLAHNFIHWQKGPFASLPVEKPRYHFRIKLPAGVRRHRPWLSTFSAITHKSWPENQFFMDRQVRFSVWHDNAGLIISGSNTRGNQRGGTFFMSRNLDQAYGLPKKGKLVQTPSRDILSAKYTGFSAELGLKPIDARRFEILAKVKDEERPRPLIDPIFETHIFLNLKFGDVIETQTGEKRRLTNDYFELSPGKVGKWIKKGQYRLHVPALTRLVWPYFPFYPYSITGQTGSHRLGLVILFFENPKKPLQCLLEVNKG